MCLSNNILYLDECVDAQIFIYKRGQTFELRLNESFDGARCLGSNRIAHAVARGKNTHSNVLFSDR